MKMIFKHIYILLLFNLGKLNWCIRIVNAFIILEGSTNIHQELSKNNVSFTAVLKIGHGGRGFKNIIIRASLSIKCMSV